MYLCVCAYARSPPCVSVCRVCARARARARVCPGASIPEVFPLSREILYFGLSGQDVAPFRV